MTRDHNRFPLLNEINCFITMRSKVTNNTAEWMQKVAVEMNLSETAFLEKREVVEQHGNKKVEEWAIRWFTPTDEIGLCGHATLASAHALWDTGKVSPSSSITFSTQKVGNLSVSLLPEDDTGDTPKVGGWMRMQFPVGKLTSFEPTGKDAAWFASALGVDTQGVLGVAKGPASVPDWLVEVTPEEFLKVTPDHTKLADGNKIDRGVTVTCRGDAPRSYVEDKDEDSSSFTFTSRSFFPLLGVPEDPVCGSAHTLLAPYWRKKLGLGFGDQMLAWQASARGGALRLSVEDEDLCFVEGKAVTVMEAALFV